ncbi:hypothetical protein ACJJIF_11185 [Microbulbifer sp. SSSA002]|uniref:hypothetical protein n=1 Tax=Microbulbifer sp. SSSA002 TaxID=3243376 RepID=UPI00403A0D79
MENSMDAWFDKHRSTLNKALNAGAQQVRRGRRRAYQLSRTGAPQRSTCRRLGQQLPIGGRVALCAQNHIGLPSAFLAILVDHSITPTYKRMLFLNGNNRPTAAELIAAHHDAPVAARPGTPPLE